MICLENVLKISLQDVLKMISFQDILKMTWRRLKDVLKMSWRFLEDVFAGRFEEVLARRLEDVWPQRIHWSWSRRFEDVLKTSSEDEDEKEDWKTIILSIALLE